MDKEKKIQYAHFLIERVTKDFLQEGSPYIIQEGFEHLRELITLYAKQTNLLESILLLIESNMAEEAFIILRSMINNYMLLNYLKNDDEGRTRLKEFNFQPYKSQLKFLYDLRKGIMRGWIKQEDFPSIEDKIAEHEEVLKDNGYTYYKKGKKYYNTVPITISKMIWDEELLYNYYITHYKAASAFEHSDPTSLGIYKKQLIDEYDSNNVFALDLSRTNEELDELVINTSIGVYTMSYLLLLKYFSDNYDYLIEDRKSRLIEIGLIMNSTNL